MAPLTFASFVFVYCLPPLLDDSCVGFSSHASVAGCTECNDSGCSSGICAPGHHTFAGGASPTCFGKDILPTCGHFTLCTFSHFCLSCGFYFDAVLFWTFNNLMRDRIYFDLNSKLPPSSPCCRFPSDRFALACGSCVYICFINLPVLRAISCRPAGLCNNMPR